MPKRFKIRPLTQEWKNALRDNFLDRYDLDDEEIEDVLDEKDTKQDALTKYRIGPYLVIPTMSDDSESRVDVIAAVGFIVEKAIDVDVGNCSCGTVVFVEDPTYVGKRGVLITYWHHDLVWNVFLS